MSDKEMYKVNYQAGQGKIHIISILQKENDTWVLCKNNDVETLIEQRLFSKGHHNQGNVNIGYGQIILTDKLTYITGQFEVSSKL
jgi:hypothetical protein